MHALATEIGLRKIRSKPTPGQDALSLALTHERVTSPSLGASHTEARDLHPTLGQTLSNETLKDRIVVVKISGNDRCF